MGRKNRYIATDRTQTGNIRIREQSDSPSVVERRKEANVGAQINIGECYNTNKNYNGKYK